MATPAISKKREIYARERLRDSPLAVNKTRENQCDFCQCGHLRVHHVTKCLSPNCMCGGFKKA